MTKQFDISDRNRVRRVAKRGAYDHKIVFEVIDAAPIGHVAIEDKSHGGVAVIPMFHSRMEDYVIFHGATTSRLMTCLASGALVSISFAMVDGLVLAKSLFHHSMNYRSAVVFGRGQMVHHDEERLSALKSLSDKILPGRWEDARGPSEQEMKATAVVKVKIESASAKIRTGGPIDDPEDVKLPIWSGVIPVETRFTNPVADENSNGLVTPDYLAQIVSRQAATQNRP